MYTYESVVDISGLIRFCSEHAGIELSKSGLRKQIDTVWSDPVNSNKEERDYYEYDLTPGMRIKVLSGVADYPLAIAYQLKYIRCLVEENGSPEGARYIIREKRKEAADDIEKIDRMVNGSNAFEILKIIHYRCYCAFKLCFKSFFELGRCILDVRDKVMVSEEDQIRLMDLFHKVLACYQRDIERYKYDLMEHFEINCADVFKLIDDELMRITKHANEIRNAIPLDNRKIIEKTRENLFMKITRLDPNHDFPTLICLALKNESYYDITMTQDTRDGGCDIWATTKSNLGEHIHMISLKRYTTSNISVAEVNDFIHDIKKYAGVKPHLIASTKFSSNAIKELGNNAIEFMDIDAIISILIRQKMGISKGYGLDEQFWYALRDSQSEFRKGPIEKYISRTTA